jgi:radical SAM protein with 4Fe4S-binding SPASM domain
MIKDLFIEVTGLCNLKCCHCYRKNDSMSNASLADIKERISNNESSNVIITGGEALLHPDIESILKFVKSTGRTCVLITNGVELLKNKELLRLVDVLNVSLDWPDERHDKNRGFKGLSKRVIDSLKVLKHESGPKINIITTVFKENKDEIINLIKLSESIAHNIVLDRYVPIHDFPSPLSRDEALDLFKQVHDLKKQVRTEVSVYDPIYYVLFPEEGVSRYRCKQRLFADSKGTYTICPFYVRKFLSSEDALSARANEPLPKECVKCKHNSTCHGGCPATRLVTNGLRKRDPYCPVVP